MARRYPVYAYPSSMTNLRSNLIRLASTLPTGSADQKALLQILTASQKKAHGSGAANAEYLGKSPLRDKILRAVAKHYGTSISEIEAEMTDPEAEAVYEYIGNDPALQMQVHREFKSRGLQASTRTAHGPVALKQPAVMLYFIDPEKNNSKFYEMGLVGTQGGSYTLQKRWGRLTDRGGITGRVDSKDEEYPSMAVALRAMMEHKRSKTSKGYQDVSSTHEYPIGLGGAGFGWGGQAACKYIPELQTLRNEMQQQMSVLSEMRSTVDLLAKKESSMGKKLQGMVDTLAADMKQINVYLTQQLSECE